MTANQLGDRVMSHLADPRTADRLRSYFTDEGPTATPAATSSAWPEAATALRQATG